MGGRGTAGRDLPAVSNLTGGLARRLEDAYLDLAGPADAYIDAVNLADLREKLPDIGREQLDTELLRLLDDGVVNIAPNPDQQKLTPKDKAAAIMIGGKLKHLVKFIPPEYRD